MSALMKTNCSLPGKNNTAITVQNRKTRNHFQETRLFIGNREILTVEASCYVAFHKEGRTCNGRN